MSTGSVTAPPRQEGGVFAAQWPYFLINYTRSWGYDGLAMIPVVAATVWWVRRPYPLPHPVLSGRFDDGFSSVIAHGWIRFVPAALGVLLALSILRSERRVSNRGTRRVTRAFVAAGIGWGAAVLPGCQGLVRPAVLNQ